MAAVVSNLYSIDLDCHLGYGVDPFPPREIGPWQSERSDSGNGGSTALVSISELMHFLRGMPIGRMDCGRQMDTQKQLNNDFRYLLARHRDSALSG